MKYIRGFLMAWGMFCWIPCPYKEWREEDRSAQLVMLPLLGTCMGAVLCLIWWGLIIIGAGQFITGAILTASYFLMTGYIHLDGFMDCSDALMPRHPSIEERRRILKDPANGAFAVACVCVMFVMFVASMVEIADAFNLKTCSLLVVILTASRFMSAIEVMTKLPMPGSQYDKLTKFERKQTIPSFVILIIILGAAEFILADGAWWAIIGELRSNTVVAAVIVSAAITCHVDCKKLGGMNGDISGHAITLSEMFGLVVAALII